MNIPTMKLLCSLFIITLLASCGGSGGSSGPRLPSDATTITQQNGPTVARTAIDAVLLSGGISNTLPLKTEAMPIGKTLQQVFDIAFAHPRNALLAAAKTETIDCDSGSFTVEYEETSTSSSGSVQFDHCDFSGIRLHGEFNFDTTRNISTGSYTSSGDGRLSFTVNTTTLTLELESTESGNLNSGQYTRTVNLSISGSPNANFLITTEHPVSGINDDINEGVLLVQGAGGTALRISVVATNLVEVYIDDDGDGGFDFLETISI